MFQIFGNLDIWLLGKIQWSIGYQISLIVIARQPKYHRFYALISTLFPCLLARYWSPTRNSCTQAYMGATQVLCPATAAPQSNVHSLNWGPNKHQGLFFHCAFLIFAFKDWVMAEQFHWVMPKMWKLEVFEKFKMMGLDLFLEICISLPIWMPFGSSPQHGTNNLLIRA